MTKDYKQADTIYTSLLADGDSSFLNLKYAGAARYMSGHALDGVELLEKAFEIDSTDVETAMLYGASLGKHTIVNGLTNFSIWRKRICSRKNSSSIC